MSQDETSAKTHDIAALNGYYRDAESADADVFAEQRSNLLLVAGEHYNRRQNLFYRRIRDQRDLNQEQKLRLTKNHIQRICKLYANNIISMAPGVGFEPKDDQSMQDKKAADLHHAVWRDACEQYGVQSDLIDQWCDDFIQVGEVAVKIFWDPNQGEVKAYEQKVTEEGYPIYIDALGEETLDAIDPMTGMQNQLAPDEALPVFSGKMVFEEVYGFNLLRSPQARTMDESPWLCVRKMVDKADMIARYRGQPEKIKMFQPNGQDTFVVFNNGQSGYKKVENQVMVREFYFRPCTEYPRGYFYFTTQEGIFEEGELPGQVFPIVYQGFEKIQTTPRGRSAIKHMRPYQIEINRAASKIAEHQVTLGDDKILVQNGTKISAGVSLPGVRSISYTGMEPDILPGRSGEQYFEYMQGQIEELYRVMNVAEDGAEKSAQLDPYTLLYRSASQKKQFQRYIRRFENFLMGVCKTYLRLAKVHLPEDALIYAVGKNERVNIPEFKTLTDINYQIVVEAQADDVETKLGKQLVLNHVLQYIGPQLKPEDIGKLIRQMPYANLDGSFDDLTIDYDSIENDLLALDRGETPPINPHDDHVYCIKRLTLRQRQPDYKYLPPQIQQAYDMRVNQHEKLEAMKQLQIQRAQQGYIPTGGALLGCDFYVTDPQDANKTRRARIPSESLQWLTQQLAAQGLGMQELEQAGTDVQAGVAAQMTSAGGGQPPLPGVSHSRATLPSAVSGGPQAPRPSMPMGAQPGQAGPGRM